MPLDPARLATVFLSATQLPDPGDDAADLEEQVALMQRLVARGEARRLGRTSDIAILRASFDGDRLVATVQGRSGNYETRITMRPRPGHRCTCPDWEQNGLRVGPCKHVLRLGEAWWERVANKLAALEVDAEVRTAARVQTNTATIYAISPDQLHRLVQEGQWSLLANDIWTPEGDRDPSDPSKEMNQLIRYHGGSVFFIGRDGYYDVDVPAAKVEYGYLNLAHRVASAYAESVVASRVAAHLLRAAETAEVTTGEGPEVLLVDVLDLVDLEYRDLYGEPATREQVVNLLRRFALGLEEGADDTWPRNLWVDAIKQEFGLSDSNVLSLPDEEIDVLRVLWAEFEAASADGGADDAALDAFLGRAEAALFDVRTDGPLVVNPVPKSGTVRVGEKKPKLRVFDFDDTLVSSEGSVTIVKPDGERVTMNSATFAHLKQVPGDKADHGAFNNVVKPRIIKKNFDEFRKFVEDGERVVILTARPKGSASAVKKFLKEHGVEGVDVVALASSDPYDKARWIDKEIEEGGYDDVEFFDDSSANARAVAEHAEAHRKKGLKFESHNTPHPHEDDYDGPASKATFESDNPTVALVPFKPKGKPEGKEESSGGGGSSSWWDEQTPTFKEKYCDDHPSSKYCKAASVTRVASNEARKKAIKGRADKSRNRKVKEYVEDVLAKIDQAGPAAGAWLEDVESHFDDLARKPDGLLKGFKDADFDELHEVLFGVERPGKGKSAASRVAARWVGSR